LAKAASKNNPSSKIWEGNILEMPLPEEIYDVVFSFSVLQYIAPSDVVNLQNRLAFLVREGGVIVHCSIPDEACGL